MATRARRAHRPVEALTREKIQEAARDGSRSRNSIAREFSVSGETVTRICAEAGITFDRSKTEAAVRAHALDIAAEQQTLLRMMVAEVQEELDLLNAPYLVWSFGGMDGEIHSHLLDAAPMDVRNMAIRSAATVVDKVARHLGTTPEGAAAAESVLDRIEAEFDGEFAAADDTELGGVG